MAISDGDTSDMVRKYNLKSFTKKYAWPLRWWYFFGILFLTITNILSLVIPQLAKQVVNAFESNQVSGSTSELASGIILLGICVVLVRAMSRVLIFYPGRKLEVVLKSDIFNQLMRVEESFYHKFGMGEIISRLSNDVGQIRAFYAFGFLQAANLCLLLSFTVSRMLYVHWKLTLIALLPLTLLVTIMPFLMRKMHFFIKLSQERVAKLTNSVTETFVNIHAVKVSAAETHFLSSMKADNDKVYETNIDLIKFRTLLFPAIGALVYLSQAVVLFYGGYTILNGELSLGDLISFNIYLSYLGFPLSALGIIVSLLQRVRVGINRVDEIFTYQDENSSSSIVIPESESNPRKTLLNLKNISFNFDEKLTMPESRLETFSLQSVNLEIKQGERIGIVGSVGSGKTTLLKLMAGLLSPKEGSIEVNGLGLNDVGTVYLRQSLSLCEQTPVLFSDSVLGNLTMGLDEEVSDNEIWDALEMACVDEDVRQLSHGLETEIGERGIKLSGGQKQRIALARMMLRKTPLLILDDVLSAVDQVTEQKIISSLNKIDQTWVLVTHRMAALQHCTRIFEIKNGVLSPVTLDEWSRQNEE